MKPGNFEKIILPNTGKRSQEEVMDTAEPFAWQQNRF